MRLSKGYEAEWSRKVISGILSDEKYAQHAIVTAEEFMTVQQMKNDRAPAPKNVAMDTDIGYNEDNNPKEVCDVKRKVSGWLMSKDIPVAKIIDNEITPLREELLPLHFTLGQGSLEDWLKTRAVDVKRINSRLLRRALKLSDAEQEKLALAVSAATITDTYWVKEQGSTQTCDSVRFTENQYADIALLGSFTDYGKPSHTTPKLTNTGSFEKCWKQQDGAWWLYKLGDADNLFSEMAAYRLAKQLGCPVADTSWLTPQPTSLWGG